jgi:hypothetical protein
MPKNNIQHQAKSMEIRALLSNRTRSPSGKKCGRIPTDTDPSASQPFAATPAGKQEQSQSNETFKQAGLQDAHDLRSLLQPIHQFFC